MYTTRNNKENESIFSFIEKFVAGDSKVFFEFECPQTSTYFRFWLVYQKTYQSTENSEL